MNDSIQSITAPISLGELIDKITILKIKASRFEGVALKNVINELNCLEKTLSSLQLDLDIMLVKRLSQVNSCLWQIEDDIREQERQKNFGDVFIGLARSVYQKNDQRAALKKEINIAYGSALVEEKSYREY